MRLNQSLKLADIGSAVRELLFAGQEERVSQDDLIKDLAGERTRRRRRGRGKTRCQQQQEKEGEEDEEEAEPRGHSADPAHSHPDHTSVLLAAAATKLDFFFPAPSEHDWNSDCGRKGAGPTGKGSTGSRKCHAEHLELHLNALQAGRKPAS